MILHFHSLFFKCLVVAQKPWLYFLSQHRLNGAHKKFAKLESSASIS